MFYLGVAAGERGVQAGVWGVGGNVINTELGWHQRTEGLMVLSGDVVVLVIMAPQIGRL